MSEENRNPEWWIRFHQRSFPLPVKIAIVGAAIGLLVLVTVVPQGHTPSELKGERVWEEDGSYTWVRDLDPTFEVGMTLGVIAGYLLLGSIVLGHARPLNPILPGLWRKLHVAVGISLLVLAILHGLILALLSSFETWPSGLSSFLVLAYHGASGAWKTRLVRRWGMKRWRFQHLFTAYLGLALGLLHGLAL